MNVMTHLFGLLFTMVLIRMFHVNGKRKGFSKLKMSALYSFGITSFIMYFNSTIYHLSNLVLSDHIVLRYCLQRLDHVSIYILISGCYACFIILRTFEKGYIKLGWLAVFLIASMALVGFSFAIFAPPSTLTDIYMYLAMGFSCILYTPCIFYFCPFSLVVFLFSGGITYAFGTYILNWDSLFFQHGLWHLIVWFANYQHALGVLIASDEENVYGIFGPMRKMHHLFVEFFTGEQPKDEKTVEMKNN